MGFNILYVGFFSLPDKDAAANRVMNNAKALRECGHNVIFIDEQVDSCYIGTENSRHVLNEFDVWTTLRPTNIKDYIKKMISISEIHKVVSFYSNIDVVIAYNYPAIALMQLCYYCKKRNIRLVADCTEWYSGKEYKFPKNYLCAFDSFLRMRILHKRMDGIITISSFLRDYYKRNKNVIEVPPLIDTRESCWNQEEFILDNNTLNLVYAGNPGKSKENLILILESIEKSINKKRICFRIIGITEDQFIKVYPGTEALIKSLDTSVRFLGRLSHDLTIRHIKAADYMVFFRDNNRVSNAGFSTKFVESITCATSVITSSTGDIEKYINKYKVGLIANSSEELVNILDKNIAVLKQRADITGINELFDYRNYIPRFRNWTNNL